MAFWSFNWKSIFLGFKTMTKCWETVMRTTKTYFSWKQLALQISQYFFWVHGSSRHFIRPAQKNEAVSIVIVMLAKYLFMRFEMSDYCTPPLLASSSDKQKKDTPTQIRLSVFVSFCCMDLRVCVQVTNPLHINNNHLVPRSFKRKVTESLKRHKKLPYYNCPTKIRWIKITSLIRQRSTYVTEGAFKMIIFVQIFFSFLSKR